MCDRVLAIASSVQPDLMKVFYTTIPVHIRSYQGINWIFSYYLVENKCNRGSATANSVHWCNKTSIEPH